MVNVMVQELQRIQGVQLVLHVVVMARLCLKEGSLECNKPVRNAKVRDRFWKNPVLVVEVVGGLTRSQRLP